MNRQDFFEELKNVLKQNPRFVAEDGQILKTKVYDAAISMDGELLKLLLENQRTRNHFFTKVEENFVFDKTKIIWILESREFLQDSYTMYKNKIGLIDKQSDLISQKDDISLVWPYKDCVLEGEQTKDNQRRDEIFYNETLAPDEVNQLLNPKVFTNAKRYTKNNVEEATEIQKNDNLIIKGNNLMALTSLEEKYGNTIKGIFIDPPYYFSRQKSKDSFRYNSNFKLSTWLTFMNNRLSIAKNLLSDDGIMAVVIGIDGYAHLKVLMDEIFKVKDNPKRYIGTITWRKTDNQSNIGDFANVIDYIMLYRMNSDTKLNYLPLTDKAKKEYSYTDPDGSRYRRANILDLTRGRYEYKINTPDGDVLNGPWMIEESEYLNMYNNNEIHWPSRGKQIPYGKIYLKDTLEKGQITSDFWDSSYGTNQRSADEIKELFGSRIFDYAKPEKLVQNIISLISQKDEIILDFFMGTATTQAVAHKMNRQYIGVEQMDYINEISVPRLQKVIDGEQGGISEEVDWKGGGSFVYTELKELNNTYMSSIQSVESSKELDEIKDSLFDTGFISHLVDPLEINEDNDEYMQLSFEEKKKLLLELVDKNKLYINYSDIDDNDMQVNEAEKEFSHNFYRGG